MTTTDPQFATMLRVRKCLFAAEHNRLSALACDGTQLDRAFYLRRQRDFTYLAKRAARTVPKIYELYPELKEA